ncbi:hypothetical protein OEA41_006926 [Lepraria neglecta]|uniref:Uncharacterized protein n=1 Tax=Lepraria neglecta TaxID=209136 RepID=A0AAD9Z8J8_9LECA|nr:hypothetical protein OEA41_006926 [Lepraria neglecta]
MPCGVNPQPIIAPNSALQARHKPLQQAKRCLRSRMAHPNLQNIRLSASSLLILATILRPSLSYQIFDSRGSPTRATISQCRSSLSITNEHEQSQCYDMIRCILSTVPSDVTARWSAGANILAFVPTIVALLSNSIHEVAATADESIVLAVALSLSSVTAFTSRFGDMPVRASEAFFGEKDENRKVERLRGTWENIEKHMEKIKGQGRTPWSRHRRLKAGVLYILLLALSAGIWYEVYETTRYGVIVNACPIKVNVGL